MEQRPTPGKRTEEIQADLERLLVRLRSELAEVLAADCNFRVTINGSAGRDQRMMPCYGGDVVRVNYVYNSVFYNPF